MQNNPQGLPAELVQALIALGLFFLLLLYFATKGSLKQRAEKLAQAKRKEERKVEKQRAEAGNSTAFNLEPATNYFVAFYRGNSARFFRVYCLRNELLFVNMGELLALIHPDLVRGGNRDQPWYQRSRKTLSVLGIFWIVALVLAIYAGYHLFTPGPPLLHRGGTIVLFLIFAIPAALLPLFPIRMYQLDQLGRELDEMSEEEVLDHCMHDKKSFVVDRETVSEFKLQPIGLLDQYHRKGEVGSYLRFHHRPTGHWTIELPTTVDSYAAIKSVITHWGTSKLSVTGVLPERFFKTRQASQAQSLTGPAQTPADQIDASSKAILDRLAEVTREPDPAEPARDLPGTSSINGCGTMVCFARGHCKVNANEYHDADAILAFCLFGVPLIPYRAVHTYNHQYVDVSLTDSSFTYSSLPIRWTTGLVLSAILRRLVPILVVVGILVLIPACLGGGQLQGIYDFLGLDVLIANQVLTEEVARMIVVGIGLAFLLPAIIARIVLAWLNRRHIRIRLLIGPHDFGTSDPYYWSKELLELVRSAKDLFGMPTFAEAVNGELAKGRLASAMLAARLSAALESKFEGQYLTNLVLADPRSRKALDSVRWQPWARDKYMSDIERTLPKSLLRQQFQIDDVVASQ